jgi:folate-binding Fe-S cluster repair protein YgfZ
VTAFVSTAPSFRKQFAPSLHSTNVNFDYEYIPPNPNAHPGESEYYARLRSSYPPGTPAGLRGEAIRSALVNSERCIGWELSSSPKSMGGVFQIQGKGTIDFLNNKLSETFSTSTYKEACLLDAKGRLVDLLRVSVMDNGNRALVLTSPGHSTSELLKRLDPFVFPLDQVSLSNFDSESNKNAFTFTLASAQYQDVQKSFMQKSVTDMIPLPPSTMVFPGTEQCAVWKINENAQILVVPSSGLPSVACVGYTFVFFGGTDAAKLGRNIWQHLISEDNEDGPVEVGPREYETLRIEAGQPSYSHEFGLKPVAESSSSSSSEEEEEAEEAGKTKKDDRTIKTSPLELHWKSMINLDKGCYLGQEGIASILKNPRGPPRVLYAVVFPDDMNLYETQTRGDKSDIENLTVLPQPGQNLYALGSNKGLMVGTLTSVAEAGGTGDRNVVALALIKRADSIQKQMKELNLEIYRDPNDSVKVDGTSGSGIIQPPPMDQLDGLEVIVENTMTVGVLRSIPSRRLKRDSNMFDERIQVHGLVENDPRIGASSSSDDVELDESATLEEIEAEAAKAAAEAEAAAAEAKRKAEKMEMLKKRAEEALARRQQKKGQ